MTASFYCTDLHMGRTWCQHAQLRADMKSPYVLTGSKNKMAARKNKGRSPSLIYEAGEHVVLE